ncbi:unnamed protein product [Mytilus edulis]|uniref:Uncharacterized protein n=1 Tax=Mytilus edulis TaxID=6550 RepID=A0A8S3VNJ6_MYTED|nr:unnamed protein product [Mytilus edulis]
MANTGLSCRRIAVHFGVNHTVIIRLVQRYRQTGSVEDRPRAGRPRKTTPREDRNLSRQARLKPFSSADQLRRLWPIGGRTAANVLFDQLGRKRNDRVYRERIDHLDQMRDEEVRKIYRFNKESIRFICNLLRDKLQQLTKRSQALSVELRQEKSATEICLPTSQTKEQTPSSTVRGSTARSSTAIGCKARGTTAKGSRAEGSKTAMGRNADRRTSRATTPYWKQQPINPKNFQILIQRALVTFIPELKDFRDLVTFHIGHQYSKASEKKSDIDLDVMKIHALLEEEPRGSYKVNYIVTEGGRIIDLQYDNKFTINLGEFKLLKKYRVYDEKMSLPSHALCFESAPFPLNSFEEAIGLFKNPPVVAINSITNLQDHHQGISIRGEITRINIHIKLALFIYRKIDSIRAGTFRGCRKPLQGVASDQYNYEASLHQSKVVEGEGLHDQWFLCWGQDCGQEFEGHGV